MKKIFTLTLVFLLVFSLATVTAFAADNNINTIGGTAEKDVTVSYQSGGSGGTVYSVDIEWGNMSFVYSEASSGRWLPESHTYSTGSKAGWSSSGNTVTVTNHSNAAVNANLTYTQKEGFDGITGSFDKNSMSLETAAGTSVEKAPTDTAALALDGALSSTVEPNTVIGKITVTLTA